MGMNCGGERREEKLSERPPHAPSAVNTREGTREIPSLSSTRIAPVSVQGRAIKRAILLLCFESRKDIGAIAGGLRSRAGAKHAPGSPASLGLGRSLQEPKGTKPAGARQPAN